MFANSRVVVLYLYIVLIIKKPPLLGRWYLEWKYMKRGKKRRKAKIPKKNERKNVLKLKD
jgi:hypothetical protein